MGGAALLGSDTPGFKSHSAPEHPVILTNHLPRKPRKLDIRVTAASKGRLEAGGGGLSWGPGVVPVSAAPQRPLHL